MFGMAVGVWRKATSKLFDLEAKIANQVGLNLAFQSTVTAFMAKLVCRFSDMQLSS